MQNITNITNPRWCSTGKLYQKHHYSNRAFGEAALCSCFSHAKQKNSLWEDKDMGQDLKEQNTENCGKRKYTIEMELNKFHKIMIKGILNI